MESEIEMSGDGQYPRHDGSEPSAVHILTVRVAEDGWRSLSDFCQQEGVSAASVIDAWIQLSMFLWEDNGRPRAGQWPRHSLIANELTNEIIRLARKTDRIRRSRKGRGRDTKRARPAKQ